MGPLAQVWADEPDDLGAAYMRHSRARTEWERAAGLDTVTACALAPVSGPWSLTHPGGAERLASLGINPDDLPALRRAARDRTTDPRSAT